MASEPTVIVPPKQLGPAAHVSVAVLLIVPLLAEWPDVTQQFIRPVQRQEFPATRRSFCGSVVMAAAGSFLGRGSAAGDQVLVAADKVLTPRLQSWAAAVGVTSLSPMLRSGVAGYPSSNEYPHRNYARSLAADWPGGRLLSFRNTARAPAQAWDARIT